MTASALRRQPTSVQGLVALVSITGFLILGIALPGAPAAAKNVRGTTCTPPGSHTVLQTETVRVYRVTRRAAAAPRLRYKQMYGCLLSKPRPIALDDPDPSEPFGTATMMRTAGTWVGFVLAYGNDVDFRSVFAIDLKSLKGHSADAVAVFGPCGTAVRSFVLAPNGADAWVGGGAGDLPCAGTTWEVRTQRQGNRSSKLLDSGSDVESQSLALSNDGTTAYWKRGGALRSVALR